MKSNSHYLITLENLLHTLIEQLSQAKLSVATDVKAKNCFLSIISHELMSPLVSISGFSELLTTASIPQEQKEWANHINHSSRELELMFKDILTFMDLNTQEVVVKKIPFLAATMISSVSHDLQQTSLNKGLQVTTLIDSTLPLLLCDEKLLHHALSILASNAVKFTQQGHIQYSARSLATKEAWVQVEFAIEDTGIGISLEDQKNLFEIMKPLDASLTRRHRGIGLGLTLCRQLVKLLGGEFAYESNSNVGSLFRITLWLEMA